MTDTTDCSRVLVVDDHRTFTDLIALALEAELDMECVGAAHDVSRARALVVESRPDVVLMDVNLGDDDGLDLTVELLQAHPHLLVVVLTAFGDGAVMRRAAAAGASALLPKDGSLPDLLSGLRSARHGALVVHPELLHTLLSAEWQTGPVGPELTPREQEVLERLADGRTVSRIAKDLGISVHTCRGYVKTLLAKLGAHSQLEAVVIAVMRGLVNAPRRH